MRKGESSSANALRRGRAWRRGTRRSIANGSCLARPRALTSWSSWRGVRTLAGGFCSKDAPEGSPCGRSRARGSTRRRWIELARASSGALASLHALRDDDGNLAFVHGDISPDNVFFEAPAGVTFVDLSSATFRNATEPVFPNDRGTLPYVAPEIARSEVRSSPESDTYALAATLLAAAVGFALTDATTEASRLLEVGTSGVRADRIDGRSDLPERARSAIRGALLFDRALRLSSSRDLARELGNQVG